MLLPLIQSLTQLLMLQSLTQLLMLQSMFLQMLRLTVLQQMADLEDFFRMRRKIFSSNLETQVLVHLSRLTRKI